VPLRNLHEEAPGNEEGRGRPWPELMAVLMFTIPARGVTVWTDGGMKTVNIEILGDQLAHLVDEAAQGEEIVIARAGAPLAKIVPVAAQVKEPRKLGSLAGHFRIPDDFDAPLPGWLLDEFERR